MQEDFLHYIWHFKKFNFGSALTVSHLPVSIISTGTPNFNSGPDFFNAKLYMGDQLWAGNVEIHVNSSDWYAHKHEADPNYDNVILHVVWHHDVEIFRNDNTPVPTLELKELVAHETLQNYRNLLTAPNNYWINCERDFKDFGKFELDNWLERMYVERLQQKSVLILELLEKSGNNWEEVLFLLLARNFGLNVNGEAFLSMAQSLDFRIIQKVRSSQFSLEALFFGQSGMLEEKLEDVYFNRLKDEYLFLKRKFRLYNSYVERAKFFRLRPDNFPNIRLSQLAFLIYSNSQLFSEVIKAKEPEHFRQIFNVGASGYWKTNYTFSKPHKEKEKFLTQDFKNLIIINTLIPLKFCYFQKTGIGDCEEVTSVMQKIISEKNSIINGYNRLRPSSFTNALQTQALLHLKSNYCDKNLCLKCNLGIKLLQGSGI